MTIETKRLLLCPLSARQMRLWLSDLPALEREWDCHYEGEPVEGTFREIVQQQWKITSMDERNYLFHSFWLLLRKADRTVVGAADFKAPPNARGEVEIGYGLGGAHERRGYMTEAVDALCDWALQREDVESVLAETERKNRPSQNVLRRCRFVLEHEGPTLWWRRKNRIRAADAQVRRPSRVGENSFWRRSKTEGFSEKAMKKSASPDGGRMRSLFCPLAGCDGSKRSVK